MAIDLAQKQFVIPWVIQGDEAYGVRSATLYLTAALNHVEVQTPLISLGSGPFVQECRERSMHVVELDVGLMPGLAGGPVGKVRAFGRLLRHQRAAVHRLFEAAQQFDPDALHFRWPNLVGLVGTVARRLDVPALWQMPNYVSDQYPFGLNRRYYQWQCHRLGIVPLGNSAYTASTLGDRPVRPRVFHLAADTERFDPQRVTPFPRRELGIPSHAVVLGIVARIDQSKGQLRILQAMLRLVAEGEDLHLVLLGAPTQGPEPDRLRRLAAEHAAQSRLHLLGRVPDPERYYGLIDLPINSRIDAEPFGLSVIEAMMMARPILVHALGGPAETVVDGKTGWHVSAPTVEAFTAGLRRALDDRPRWNQMRLAARKHACENFSTDGQARRYLAIVREVLGQRAN